MAGGRLRVCCVCISNQNRSMEAHRELALRGYAVNSYGTGSSVKLPGRTIHEPVRFPFNMPYEQMREKLNTRDGALYTDNGVLAMLDRNAKVKRAPEQWKDARGPFDIIITFEERVFRTVLEDFISNRSPVKFDPSYIINLEIVDTHSAAASGAKLVVELVDALDGEESVDTTIHDIVSNMEKKHDTMMMVAPVFC